MLSCCSFIWLPFLHIYLKLIFNKNGLHYSKFEMLMWCVLLCQIVVTPRSVFSILAILTKTLLIGCYTYNPSRLINGVSGYKRKIWRSVGTKFLQYSPFMSVPRISDIWIIILHFSYLPVTYVLGPASVCQNSSGILAHEFMWQLTHDISFSWHIYQPFMCALLCVVTWTVICFCMISIYWSEVGCRNSTFYIINDITDDDVLR